ncbi:MAG: CBS domain-containing protein [Methanomassiliicoccales archaeon]|jgi:CBS domain-containing protein|nr:CBS domain-containing protein [Methanomassiliicoccales archaeon]NYT15137.1 CBS domain-containing protein [Methanomassiliicoccales archaeon]
MREIEDMRADEVMEKDVVYVSPITTVKELKDLFEKHDYNSFPVVEKGEIVGIVSKLDFLKIFTMGTHFSRSDYWKLFAENVGGVMRRAVISVEPDDSLRKVVEYMVEFNLRSLPVVEGSKLVGIISRKDVMSHLLLD